MIDLIISLKTGREFIPGTLKDIITALAVNRM